MLKARHVILLLLATSILAAGCASPIHIVSPTAGPQANAIPEVQVSLSAKQYIDSWSVDLDGTTLSGYSPSPGPGVTSAAPLEFSEGTTTHVLTTHSTCGAFCVWGSETVSFTPPKLHWNGTNTQNVANLSQFATVGVFVGVQYPPSVAIPVTVQEITNPPSVKLGLPAGPLQQPGSPLIVVIPAGSTKSDFNVQAESLGNIKFKLTAPGTIPSTVGVFVKK
jgi:hypothetical protein